MKGYTYYLQPNNSDTNKAIYEKLKTTSKEEEYQWNEADVINSQGGKEKASIFQCPNYAFITELKGLGLDFVVYRQRGEGKIREFSFHSIKVNEEEEE